MLVDLTKHVFNSSTLEVSMIKLVLSDMDQTLKPAKNPSISNRTHQAIKNLKSAGISFGPATGRSVYDALPYLKSDISMTETGIFGSGKLAYANGKLALKKAIPYEIMQRIFEVIAPMGDVLISYCEEGPLQQPLDASFKSSSVVVGTTQETIDYLISVSDAFVPVLGPKTIPLNTDFLAAGLLVPLDHTRQLEIISALKEAVPEIDLMYSYKGWYDINLHNWNKAQAYEVLIDSMGLSPEEVVVCGDSGNDIELLKLAPHSCCVENGTEEAKAASAYLLPSVYEEGVAQLLEALTEAQGDFDAAVVQAILK